MSQVIPYLFFNGNCRQAMEFYAKQIGGELELMTYAEAPQGEAPPGLNDRIMNSSLRKGDFVIMASDGMDQDSVQFGNSVQLCLSADTVEEAEKLFRALSEKGRVTLPLAESFFAKRFGMLTDAFGIKWMVTCEGK